jgi:hypothetical protein
MSSALDPWSMSGDGSSRFQGGIDATASLGPRLGRVRLQPFSLRVLARGGTQGSFMASVGPLFVG